MKLKFYKYIRIEKTTDYFEVILAKKRNLPDCMVNIMNELVIIHVASSYVIFRMVSFVFDEHILEVELHDVKSLPIAICKRNSQNTGGK